MGHTEVHEIIERSTSVRPAAPAVSRSSARVECDRLEHDLHESMGTTLDLLLRRIDVLLEQEPDRRRRGELARLRDGVARALASLREVVDALDALRYRSARLDRTLREMAADLARVTDACVDVRASGPVGDLHDAQRAVLARVARTALFDVCRHGRASVVVVTLSVAPDRVALDVADDGVDLKQRAVAGWRSSSPDFALASVARAVSEAGGRLLVLRGQPRGVRLRALVPRRREVRA